MANGYTFKGGNSGIILGSLFTESLLLKKRICSIKEQILSFKIRLHFERAVPYGDRKVSGVPSWKIVENFRGGPIHL